jgi:anti-sigma B factor antagonist
MEIRERMSGPIAIVELHGRLTINDQPGQLKDTVAAALARGARHVLLDLSHVNYIDSTRLGELIAVHISVSRQNGVLRLIGTPDRILELLSVAGLDGVFQHFPTEEDACQGLS